MVVFEERLTLNGQLLNDSALATAVVGGQGESLDAAASTDTAGQDVVGVQIITTLRNIKLRDETPSYHVVRRSIVIRTVYFP